MILKQIKKSFSALFRAMGNVIESIIESIKDWFWRLDECVWLRLVGFPIVTIYYVVVGGFLVMLYICMVLAIMVAHIVATLVVAIFEAIWWVGGCCCRLVGRDTRDD